MRIRLKHKNDILFDADFFALLKMATAYSPERFDKALFNKDTITDFEILGEPDDTKNKIRYVTGQVIANNLLLPTVKNMTDNELINAVHDKIAKGIATLYETELVARLEIMQGINDAIDNDN